LGIQFPLQYFGRRQKPQQPRRACRDEDRYNEGGPLYQSAVAIDQIAVPTMR
jgi:hypothetical protein